MLLIPKVWSQGGFTFHDPFATRDPQHKNSTVTAVRTFGDILNNGRDPFTKYYVPLELDKDTYDKHAQENGGIVSLKSESGHVWDVPFHYIKSMPLAGGIPYDGLAMVMNLGPIAKGKDLDFLLTKVNNLILDNIGIESKPHLVQVAETTLLTLEEADRIEASRENAIRDTHTDSGALAVALARVAELEAENALMAKYIKDNL